MVRILIVLFTTLFCCTANASNYFGIDYKHLWLSGRDQNNIFMNDVLASSYNGLEVYASHRFDNDVGLTFGYEQYKTQDTSHVFSQGEIFLGSAQNAGDTALFSTKLRAFSLDLNGFLNITECFEAIGQLGISLVQADMTGILNANAVQYNLDPGNCYSPVPRIGLIIQYFCTKYVGFRVVGQWVGMNMFRMDITDEDGSRQKIRPFNQGWSLGVGLVGKFL